MTEWADDARTRQGLYRFIGAALRPPGDEQLALLTSASGFFDERDPDRYAYAAARRRFNKALTAGTPVECLEIEYVRLFGVGMAGTPAPPTESYYRVASRDGGVAEFVSALQRTYRSMGIVAVGDAEAPDHISIEMEAMSFLCGVEAEAWESQDIPTALETRALEARFLNGHLALWVPVFAERTRSAHADVFYRSLIDLLHAFVIGEADYLQVVAKRSTTH